MGWLILGSGKGRRRCASTAVGLALAATLAACAIDPPQPPFELSPTTDQISQVLKTQFAAAHDPTGALCSSDFALTDVAVRETAETLMTTHRSYSLSVDLAYTATLTKPAANLKALTDACFPSNAPLAAWAVGQSQTVFSGAQMSWATTGWTLAVGWANGPSATYQFANAATPHPYKMGSNDRPAR